MLTDDSQESKFIQAFVRNGELRAKVEEARLREYQEILERLKLLERAWMKAAVESDEDHSGATGRLDKAALERARLQAGQARIEKNLVQFMIQFDTYRRHAQRNESLLTQMWRAWRERGEVKE